MTANESTPSEGDETSGIDYERLGRETAARELERYASRIQTRFREAAEKAENGELTQDDVAELHKELANAQVWVASIGEGRRLEASDVLD